MEDGYRVAEKYTKIRQCINCKLHYNEIDNFGRHMCQIHPGLRLRDHSKREYYSCCGIYIDAYSKGQVTHLFVAGCLSIDHMDESSICTGERTLTVTEINRRLTEIKGFATVVIPSILLNRCNVVPPNNNTIILDYNGLKGLPLAPLMNLELDALHEARDNHYKIASQYDPHYYGLTNVPRNIEYTPRDMLRTNQDIVQLEIHKIADAMNKCVTPLNSRRSVSSLRKNNASNSRDGWPDFIKKDGDETEDEDNLHLNKKRDGTPFMIIQRIGHKLNIHHLHSKLHEL